MGIVTATRGSDIAENTSDLLVVKESGEIQCYDGTTLLEKWASPSSALVRDSSTAFGEFKVEFAHLTNAHSAGQGILRGRQDVFALFPQEVAEDGLNPEVLVLITKSKDTTTRTLHIVSLPRRLVMKQNSLKHSVDSLLAARIPSNTAPETLNDSSSFSIQVSAGILQQLEDDVLTTFDLSDTLPKIQSTLVSVSAQSFLRLSSTAIMVSSKDSINVYNPKYQSILATTELEPGSNNDSLKRKRDASENINRVAINSCKFVTYFSKVGVAVAISNNNLVAIQVEGQHDSHGKARGAGLLIDSIGRSVKGQVRPGRIGRESKKSRTLGSTTLEAYLPGSIGDMQWEKQKAEAESLFSQENLEGFDALIASYLEAQIPLVNGSHLSNRGKDKSCDERSLKLAGHAEVDRRWVLFALSKIFTMSETEAGELALTISFYPPNTFTWLATNGHMTITNIESALRSGGESVVPISAGQLVNALVEVDPDMDLLLAVLARNYLGAAELLHAIRKLMASLGLLGENPGTKQGLLTNGNESESAEDIEEQLEKLEAEAEQDLELAEYQLGPGSGIRADALSLALSKLYRCPSKAIVHSLQTTLTSQEIVCLIYLLRFELARGSWTTRYVDADEAEIVNKDAEVPDNAIILISSLLNNCVDAVGAGGWLSGEARLVDGDPFEAEELIASLKLEVSAALEGIEEAVYLKGLTSEMIRYGDGVQAAMPKPASETQAEKRSKPIILPPLDQDLKTLPLGLKAEKQISLLKAAAGGAVHKRTRRDIGYLKSQKVGKYSRERIII
jgi:hypothetical protein